MIQRSLENVTTYFIKKEKNFCLQDTYQFWLHRTSVFQAVENQRCSCLRKSCSARQSVLKQVQFEKDCLFIFRENQINSFSQCSFEEISIITNMTTKKLPNQGARVIATGCITFH